MAGWNLDGLGLGDTDLINATKAALLYIYP
jgi:hypothetical protein